MKEQEKEKLILMYKDLEVLSFEVDYEKRRVNILEKLENFDKAPYGIASDDVGKMKLQRFFNARALAEQRNDYKKIMEATNSRNSFELSFKGHGLSLANHYWFKRENEDLKYDDINFFTNKWDDSFGRAIINGDYEALKTCDLNVPDIVTPGWGVKGWIYEDGPKLYKLGIHNEHPDEAICEVLASRLANRIFRKGEALEYKLEMVNGHYASVCSPLITLDEELVPLSNVLPYEWYYTYRDKNTNKNLIKEFFDKLADFGSPILYEFFVKVSCFRSLAFVSDLHFDNLSLIRDMKTGKTRPAPLYDLGGAFGSSETGKNFIANANKGAFLLIYFMFNELEPDWDYSWYDPRKLEGFEDEMKEYLSKSEFYTPDLIETVIAVYHQQKKTLDEMKMKK